MAELNKHSPFYDRPKIIENEYAFAIYDGFAISKGHALVVPKEQVSTFFELEPKAYHQCFELVRELTIYLAKEYHVSDFNIGINNGRNAGQTIAHAHIHIIPRYKDDVVAGVIRNNGKFLIACRSKGKHLGGFWEYPGGKVEEGELEIDSLRRELNEEFGIEVKVGKHLIDTFFRYERLDIRLKAYLVEHLSGDFILRNHDAIRWVTAKEFHEYKFAPADVAINDYIVKYGI